MTLSEAVENLHHLRSMLNEAGEKFPNDPTEAAIMLEDAIVFLDKILE